MQAIDREKFLFAFQGPFGTLNTNQLSGLNFLIDQLEADDNVTDIRHAAYMLATAWHETGKTLQPIEEYGKGTGHKYGVPDPGTGKAYYGRGYVQLTWKDNYAAMGRVLGKDFVSHPELVMVPEDAYLIMSHGMRRGSFTGARLSMYIHDDACDYVSARKIINGTDCAAIIAKYAAGIEKAFSSAV